MNTPPVARAKAKDAALLADLHGACFAQAWDAAAMTALLRHGGCGWVIFTPDPAGFALLRRAADEAEVLSLAVRKAVRRAGLGRALLKAACRGIAAEGARTVFLDVARNNTAARRLYDSEGFVVFGQRAGYYAGGEDAILYRRQLGRV